jgi:uncharacterized membrane protein
MNKLWTQYSRHLLLFAVLVLSSGMSLVLFGFRVFYADTRLYHFLVWNLFLAWIPVVCAVAAWLVSRKSQWKPAMYQSLAIPFLLCWLLFFPNAPYLVTDMIHLAPRSRVPLWYDVVLLMSFVWNGLILGFVSLSVVHSLFEQWFGRAAGWTVVGVALAAGSFGVYLGRFLRWNSWDLLLQPRLLALDIVNHLLNPLDHLQGILVTLLFFGFLSVGYLTVNLLTRMKWEEVTH